MIQVAFFKQEGDLIGFEASGHAGYDVYGRDIVCAAVSGILLTTLGGIDEVVGVHPKVKRNDETGYLHVLLPLQLEEAAKHDRQLGKVQLIELRSQEQQREIQYMQNRGDGTADGDQAKSAGRADFVDVMQKAFGILCTQRDQNNDHCRDDNKYEILLKCLPKICHSIYLTVKKYNPENILRA